MMYLYAVGVADEYVRFGVGRHPHTHLAAIQADCPATLALLAMLRLQNREVATEFERLVRAVLKPDALRGEWFGYSQTTVDIIASMKGYDADRFKLKVRRYLTQAGESQPTRTAASRRQLRSEADQGIVEFLRSELGVRRRFQ
jgi:hypothetical protein